MKSANLERKERKKNVREVDASELTKKISDDGLVKIILYKLSCGERVALTVTGNSMLPFLRDSKDSVILGKLEKPPKRGDIVFYRRKNGAYVLHRVVKRKGENYYFSGDAQLAVEGPIEKGCLLAVCESVVRDGKEISKNSPQWLSYKFRFFKTKRKI